MPRRVSGPKNHLVNLPVRAFKNRAIETTV